MALLKEAAAEGASLRNLDFWKSLSSGRIGSWGKAGSRWYLQLTPFPLFLPQGTFASRGLKVICLPSCLEKPEAACGDIQESKAHLLGRRDLPVGPRFRSLV